MLFVVKIGKIKLSNLFYTRILCCIAIQLQEQTKVVVVNIKKTDFTIVYFLLYISSFRCNTILM